MRRNVVAKLVHATENVFFEAAVDFYICLEIFGLILVDFCSFSVDSDGSGGLGKVLKWEWCRNHPKIWSRGRFLNILGCDNLRGNVFACKLSF